MIVTVLGGSAHSTPVLFSFLGSQPELPHLEFRLVGRSTYNLEGVVRASELIIDSRQIDICPFPMDTREICNALRGSDIVVIQIRFGGLQGRSFDETFPLQYQLCGDEGLGAGGLSSAWRSWPAMERLLATIRSVCPQALVLLLSSPVGLLTTLAFHSFPQLKVAGICELPWTTLKIVCASLGVAPEQVECSYAGINHIGWLYDISAGARNLVDEYASFQDRHAEFPSGELIRGCRGIPLKYLRLHYYPAEVLNEQRMQNAARGDVLFRIAMQAIEIYRNGNRDQIISALGRRPAPWYTDAVGPLILAANGVKVPTPAFLSVPNEDSVVFEVCHEWHDGTWIARQNRTSPPPLVWETLMSFVRFETLAAAAVCSRDKQQLALALSNHPWIKHSEIVDDLVKEITSQQQPN